MTERAHLGGSKGDIRHRDLDRAGLAVARRSAESRATVPDLELEAELRAEALLARTTELSCTTTAMVVRACALALREVPHANGAYRDGRLEIYSRVNIGVTVATEDVYAVPTIFDADAKSAPEINAELAELAERARRGALAAPALAGATFTLTDLGRLGVGSGTPVIVPPQAAAVAVGTIREVPVVADGGIVPGRTMTLRLACDHRILYGAHAAALLRAIGSRVEQAAL
ncbi:MAG: 2-oxo acid dehydrogenase subunit E2 [Solirubrobacteraceae bacterium]